MSTLLQGSTRAGQRTARQTGEIGQAMTNNGKLSISPCKILQRTHASFPKVKDLSIEIRTALSSLQLPVEEIRGKRIAIAIGSRGICDLAEVVRSVCEWLRELGAQPFVFPGMGSHGGGTAEGQRKVLEEYGVSAEDVGAEISAAMDTVNLGTTPEGFTAFMARNAWEADGVLVINRVKPHTDFTGKIESGLLKMMAVGMGKVEGAQEMHRWASRYGYEKVIRGMARKVLASGKILGGLALIENEFHELCVIRAAQPESIAAIEEAALELARSLVPRIPFAELQILIVDQIGKNISGAGMDTKIVGRGVKVPPGHAPKIDLIYVRDLTPESNGNATGVGLADFVHQRVHRKVDWENTCLNVRTALNPILARLPMYFPSDRDAIDFALRVGGSPEAEKQRIVWIRDTLSLERIVISRALAQDAGNLKGWQLLPEDIFLRFDREDNLCPFGAM
jgi:hypothetical protein